MHLDQALAFAIMAGTLVMLIWGRLRYDLVALLALLTGIATGIVPFDQAFSGFSDQIVIIVASALVVSAAISRSGVVEALMRPLGMRTQSMAVQLPILVVAVTVMSAFIKNVGALAILMPITLQAARKTSTAPSRVLMPLAFGSLLGGLMTLVGTSPNIIVSRVRAEIVGEPFRMFDFAPVGAGLAVIGVAFLCVGWRLLPKDRGSGSASNIFEVSDYSTEARLTDSSPLVGKTVHDLESLSEDEVGVVAVIREGGRWYIPAGHWVLFAGDELVLRGEADALRKLIEAGRLTLVADRQAPAQTARGQNTSMEAVITPGSILVGTCAAELRLRDRFGTSLLAISRRGRSLRQRLQWIRFETGDLLVLQGRAGRMPESLAALGCLPLAERNLRLGRKRVITLPVVILAAAVILLAFQLVPVTVAFFGAAVLMVLCNALSPKEAYDSIDWPVLVLLAALIPVSESLSRTGATELIAQWLASLAHTLPPLAALTLVLVTAMAVTPFLNNAATVLVMAPIGASLAQRLGLNVDPFLMAVAVGAGCDFLTPIGHQCNTLVMGPGGYRFGDYARLGFPLSLVVIAAAPLLISQVWPL